jgi:hypothetical protein
MISERLATRIAKLRRIDISGCYKRDNWQCPVHDHLARNFHHPEKTEKEHTSGNIDRSPKFSFQPQFVLRRKKAAEATPNATQTKKKMRKTCSLFAGSIRILMTPNELG